MGSRRCCSCEQVARCEGCCSDCLVSYTLERKGYLLESGSPFGIEGDAENPAGNADPFMPQVPGDEILAHFGSKIDFVNTEIQPSPVQQSYKNIGSFWTWYPPAFMVDFNPHFPSCTTLPIRSENTSPCFSEFTTPDSNPETGDRDNYCYPKNNIYQPPFCSAAAQQTGYYCSHSGSNCGKPKFDSINQYDPYDGGYPNQISSPIFGGEDQDGNSVVIPDGQLFKVGGSINFKQAYACSTPEEDKCCSYTANDVNVDRIITGEAFNEMHIVGPFGQIIQNEPTACNYLGLTKYRRRMIKSHYPWAWQIFSYNLDKLLPFGNPTWHWAQVGQTSILTKVSQEQALPSEDILHWTSLRFQFLGFAFCEHHYDRYCGCFYKDEGIKDEINFGRYIPRRFMFACSGIPMFEFDIYEAMKDGKFEDSDNQPPEFVELWKSFTTWRVNSNRQIEEYPIPSTDLLEALGIVGAVDPRAVPDVKEIEQMRDILNVLTRRKYSGIRVTDWRYEATLDIIKANDLYKEAIRKRKLLINPEDDTEVNFDIIQTVGGFNFTIEQVRANPKQYSREIFPKPLGPVRKRCRMNNAPVSMSVWNNNGDGNLVTLTSEHGVNVLVPRTFSLDGIIQPQYVVDTDFIELQAINWFDIGKPYTQAQSGGSSEIPKFNGSLTPPDLENFPDINWTERELAQDLNNNLSHLMYTYFCTQPNGWDWIGNGPQLNRSKPENNWWNRKFANTQGFVIEEAYQIVNRHTPLSRMTRGVLEYAWNPNATGWFK